MFRTAAMLFRVMIGLLAKRSSFVLFCHQPGAELIRAEFSRLDCCVRISFR